jgi:hypothetical protein
MLGDSPAFRLLPRKQVWRAGLALMKGCANGRLGIVVIVARQALANAGDLDVKCVATSSTVLYILYKGKRLDHRRRMEQSLWVAERKADCA